MAKATPTTSRRRVLRLWAFEFVTSVFSLALMVAIGVTLIAYNGKPSPNWGPQINLNALLALLSTLLRAALVFLVSQVISQRKWHYFSDRAQPLHHLQQFDSASRGSLDALSLIPTVVFNDSIALTAAIVLVVSFLIGPFVQQASRAAECCFTMDGVSATIPYAHFVPRDGGYNEVATGPYKPSTNLSIALLSAVTAPQGVENGIVVNCPTGNCTFSGTDAREARKMGFHNSEHSIHSTVGVCSSCTDLSSLISNLNSTAPHLPNDVRLGLVNASNGTVVLEVRPSPNLDWMNELLTEETKTYARWAYTNVTLLSRGLDGYFAAACSLYPCLRTYNTSYINNELSEKVIRSCVMGPEIKSDNTTDAFLTLNSINGSTNFDFDYVAADPFCQTSSTTSSRDSATHNNTQTLSYYGPTSEKDKEPFSLAFHKITTFDRCIYRHSRRMASAMATTLNKHFFEAKLFKREEGLVCEPEGLRPMATVRTVYIGGNSSYTRTAQWFDLVATAITNRFRFHYGSAKEAPRGTLPLDVVHGLAWQTSVCVDMHWEWLLLPVTLTLVSVFLLAKTIMADWRRRDSVPVWKERILPFLFYPERFEDTNGQTVSSHREPDLPADILNAGIRFHNHPMDLEEMSKEAKGIAVRLSWYDNPEKCERASSISIDTSLQDSDAELITLRRRTSLSPKSHATHANMSSALMARRPELSLSEE